MIFLITLEKFYEKIFHHLTYPVDMEQQEEEATTMVMEINQRLL